MDRSEYIANQELAQDKAQQTIAKLNARYRQKKLEREANRSLIKKIFNIFF